MVVSLPLDYAPPSAGEFRLRPVTTTKSSITRKRLETVDKCLFGTPIGSDRGRFVDYNLLFSPPEAPP